MSICCAAHDIWFLFWSLSLATSEVQQAMNASMRVWRMPPECLLRHMTPRLGQLFERFANSYGKIVVAGKPAQPGFCQEETIWSPQGRAGVLHLRMRVKCEFLNFESTQAISFIHVDLVHPCQSVPIDLAPRASQAKKRQTLLCAAAGDATYAIGFGPCRILLLFFLFAKIRRLNEAMAGTTRNAVFFEVRASWIILGYFCIRIRVPELCQE